MSQQKTTYNPNLLHLLNSYRSGSRGSILEGSSRSGKTYSAVDFIIWLCTRPENTNLVIYLLKETYNSFKTTLYSDFNNRLPQHGIRSPIAGLKEIQMFDLFGNRIYFIGADQPSKFHGAGCDMFWINEALDVQKTIFDQLEMRCRSFWWMDYNPKVSDHWIFDLEKRQDVTFCHTTVLDNPYVSHWEKTKILSYEPIQANIDAGTADDYMWKVYGLGLRASPQGLVFPNITYIDDFPEDVDRVWYGLDFGYTVDPSALVKIAVNGTNLYLQEKLYTPTESVHLLHQLIGPEIGTSIVWADSADPQMIRDLQTKGLRCYPVKKSPGSIKHGIDVMKRFKIHLVRSYNFKREAENYTWRVIQGIQLNEPIDDFNHLWDAARYGCQMELAKRKGFTL